MERTYYNGNLRVTNVGEEVTLLGWVANKRNLGGVLFIDLRDTTGIVQLTVREGVKIPDIRTEYVISCHGVVAKKEKANPKLATGEVEVLVDEITVINEAELPPFIIADNSDALEDTRLEYRYLDLRRPILQKRLRTRAQIVKITHEYFDSHDFTEIETPILNLATPEGARDYIVPSRLHEGKFYALPQSPQLFKQLLMVGGMERYYQIAKCFRDEDLRSDRQPEFTQIDVECSFMSQDSILTLGEGYLARLFKETVGVDIELPLRRMPYYEAMNRFGSDKPDTRYGLELVDLNEVLSGIGGIFPEGVIKKGIIVPNYSHIMTRKVLDSHAFETKKFGVAPLFSLKMENGTLEGSFKKFLNEESEKKIVSSLGLKEGDVLLFGYHHSFRPLCFGLGALRTKIAKELNLIKEGTYDLLWIVDFPMFEKNEDGTYSAEHHPFTRPRDEDLPYLDTDPEKVLAYAYDIVINGYEAGGGTLRIYNRKTQWKIFSLLGLSDEDVARRFGWFIDAFKYGAPPHGGFAFGLDRLSMILTGTDNIRDVIAFPKNLQATDPMSKAPGSVSQDALDDVHISIKEE